MSTPFSESSKATTIPATNVDTLLHQKQFHFGRYSLLQSIFIAIPDNPIFRALTWTLKIDGQAHHDYTDRSGLEFQSNNPLIVNIPVRGKTISLYCKVDPAISAADGEDIRGTFRGLHE